MTMRIAGARLNEYLTGCKCGSLLLKAAAPLFLAPILLRLAGMLANVDILWVLDRYSFDPTIYHVQGIMTTRVILPGDLADVNRLIGLFGALLLFAKGKYTLLGGGFALAGFTYLFEPLPYWLSGNFGGELLLLSISYAICVCAFSALSAASFREAHRIPAENADTPEPPVAPLKKPRRSIALTVLAWLAILLATVIVAASCFLSFILPFGFAPRIPPHYIPNTTPAEDCTVKIPTNLRAYYYYYYSNANDADDTCSTFVEPDPDGGYSITKDAHSADSQTMHITYEQYLELTELFNDYGILTLDEYSQRTARSHDIELSFFSAYGDRTSYYLDMQDACGVGASSTIGDFFTALEEKHDSFGQWNTTGNEP